MILNMTGMAKRDQSMIIVTAPTGSAVTCSMGDAVKTAVEKNGVWTFSGLDLGTWTVTATLGEETASTEVPLERLSIEYVTLEYAVYLYKNGDQCTDLGGSWGKNGFTNASYQTQAIVLNADHIHLGNSSGYHSIGGKAEMIDLTPYSTLACKCNSVSGTGSDISIKAAANKNIASGVIAQGSLADGVVNVDISAVNRSAYIVLYATGGLSGNITEIYLKK